MGQSFCCQNEKEATFENVEINQRTNAPQQREFPEEKTIDSVENEKTNPNLKSAALGYVSRKKYKQTLEWEPPRGFVFINIPIESAIPKFNKKLIKKHWEFQFEEKPEGEYLPPLSNAKDLHVYEGNWLRKKLKHGPGREIYPDGTMFVGNFREGKANGKGRLVKPDGVVYEGEFKNGQANGKGTLYKKNGAKYEGDFRDDMQDGKGTETWEDGTYYEGYYSKNKKHGSGKLVWSQNNYYLGEFKNNLMEGAGEYRWSDGKVYKGSWKQGKMHGKGEFNWPNGSTYKGNYAEDLKHGKGKMSWKDGRVYDGHWKEGLQHGEALYSCKKYSFNPKKSLWENGEKVKWLD